MPQRISTSKLAAEFLVIFVSVILALLADDWREKQLLIKEERIVLESMLVDLEEDQRAMLFFAGKLDEIRANTALALAGLTAEQAPDPESWADQMLEGSTLWLYRPTYPTYQGLIQSGRLNLIRDPELRERLVEYHDNTVDYLFDLRMNAKHTQQALRDAMNPYFIWQPADEDRWRASLYAPIEELRADAELRGNLGRHGRSMSWLRQRITDLFEPHNVETAEAIRAYLAGSELPAVTWSD